MYLRAVWRTTIVKSFVDQPGLAEHSKIRSTDGEQLSRLLACDLLEKVVRPGQYLGCEWGAARRPWNSAQVRLALAFPDLYELGMSNFGLRILYQIVNQMPAYLADRSYAPDSDMEGLLRARKLPLWGWESRKPLADFDLIGFSLQYELTYTNVLNMLDLAGLPVVAAERDEIFPLVFGGGPSAVNPEPMAKFMDFFIIGDGEVAVPSVMALVKEWKDGHDKGTEQSKLELLASIAERVPGVYVPALYEKTADSPVVKPIEFAGKILPERVERQVQPLSDANQPTEGIVPYLSLVHDRAVLEVRRGCDRGCRFCQPGYTFLPVRERSADDLVRLSTQALAASGHQEYSMLSLCVSDYTSLHDAVRALNRQHSQWRASMSFPSQRADRMNLDLAEELKTVRKSGITLAPEAGSERLRAVINKGLNHGQIISAIEAAYQAGWRSIKLYFMLGLPTETDEDLLGIIDILKEATFKCKQIRRAEPGKHGKPIEFTCTLSNFVPKPFTPFQWFGQIDPEETSRRQKVLKEALKNSGLKNVTLNFTDPQISLLEAVISRGDRRTGDLIYGAWLKGATFDAWDDRFKPERWHEVARALGSDLTELACTAREVGSRQPWDIVHVGLADWWLVKEWQKAVEAAETAPCTENVCHACGVCSELSVNHELAAPSEQTLKKNPFVKELAAHSDSDSHPSLFFMKPQAPPDNKAVVRVRFLFTKTGEMRFISHLDLQHLLARAARRAGIAISYSEGFNPQPKLAVAVSLPLFQEGLAEVAEVDLSEPLSPQTFKDAINRQLPEQIQLTDARLVSLKNSSLASRVGKATYVAYPVPKYDPADSSLAGEGPHSSCADFDVEALVKRVGQILALHRLEVSGVAEGRKENSQPQAKDIRPGIFSVAVSREPLSVNLELACGGSFHVKPADVLKEINPDIDWRVTRLGLATPEGIPLFDLPTGVSGEC